MIEFLLNQKKITTQTHSGENLLFFIRENEYLKGTKVGCREGDCGACTVLVGTLQDNGSVDYQTVTACLASLASVSGKHVVTVEGLNLKFELNQAQQAMHDNFATQCGFCTPGFVVSLTGSVLKKNHHKHQTIDAISGNICRCTGYKSIEKAVVQLDNTLEVEEKPIGWYIENNFIPNYFQDIPQRLKEIQKPTTSNVGRLVGGGTDLYVKDADALADINIQYIAGNNTIEILQGKVILGGNVTVTQLWESEKLNEIFPKLRSYLKLISSQQIRNMASIAGNFVNASPIADLAIFFLALDAHLVLKNEQDQTRKVALKNFFLDYKKIDLLEKERIESMDFDIPGKQSLFNFEKVSKRTHLDIASVNAAMFIQVEQDKIVEVHLSVGGVAAIPKYLMQTRAFLLGKNLDNQTIAEARKVLQTEIAPIDDVRGSEKYKRLLANQLFIAHFLELFPEQFSLAELVKSQ